MEKKCYHCGVDLSGADTFYFKVLGCSTVDMTVDPPKALPIPEDTPMAFCCMGNDACKKATMDFIGGKSITKEISYEVQSNMPKMTKKEKIDLCVMHIDTILLSCKLDETNQWRWDYLKKMLESVE